MISPGTNVELGVSLHSLLRDAAPHQVRGLLGPSTLGTIQAYDPDLLTDKNIGRVAAQILDLSEILSDVDGRAKVIRLLTYQKAEELGNRLGICAKGTKLFDSLCGQGMNSSAMKVFRSFFGIIDNEDRAEHAQSRNATDVRVQYPLFRFQRDSVARTLAAISEYPHKVVLHMPTGTGKTRTAMNVVAQHLRQNDRTVVCWLAHSTELLEQAAAEFEIAWGALGDRTVDLVRFWGNRTPDILELQDGILVAGLGKVSAMNTRSPEQMLSLADRASLTIIDEAHQAVAPTYAEVLTVLHTKRPRNALLGLTATPGRSWNDIDADRKLSDFFGGIKVALDIPGQKNPVPYLIEHGYLARPDFKTLQADSHVQLSVKDQRDIEGNTDVPQYILDRFGEDASRNAQLLAEVQQLLERHKRVIVFAPSTQNAKLMAGVLSAKGNEAFVITARSRPNDRAHAIRRFKGTDESPMVIVNFGVLTAGFDVPKTSAVVIARPTHSLVLYSQMVGRATRGRRSGGQDCVEIVTMVDPQLPGFGSIADAFINWEDVWNE